MAEHQNNHQPESAPQVFLVWPREYKLSQHFARAIGLDLLLIQCKPWRGATLPFPIRYIIQSIRTLLWLLRHKPAFVYIQNPPLMAVMVVWFYTLFNKKTKYGIDHHSVFFREKKWQRFHGIARPLARQAAINTSHNVYDLRTLLEWNAVAMEMQFMNPHYNLTRLDEPLQNQALEEQRKKYPFSVFMVNRFAKNDDDYLTVIKAAQHRPDWIFFVTGNCANIHELDFAAMPPNIVCTGYMEHEEFLKLMKRCDIVLSLTLREKTILWSVREAMALGKVFVTSDTEALREYFKNVGIFTKRRNSSDLIRQIDYAANHKAEYEERIRQFLIADALRIKEQCGKVRQAIDKALERH